MVDGNKEQADMGSTSVNTKTRFLYQAFYTKTRFLYQAFYTKTRFSIPYILHENKIFDQRGGVFMEPLKNYTDHFDSKKRIRKIHSEKEFE